MAIDQGFRKTQKVLGQDKALASVIFGVGETLVAILSEHYYPTYLKQGLASGNGRAFHAVARFLFRAHGGGPGLEGLYHTIRLT